MHHPWRALRHLAHVTLHWRDLPEGILGLTNFATSTITLTTGMTQAERRCTIAHEIEHLLRGPVPGWLRSREEREVDQAVARRLIDLKPLGEALAWAHNLPEAADELWVDEATLQARMEHLHPAERAYLRRRLSVEDETVPGC